MMTLDQEPPIKMSDTEEFVLGYSISVEQHDKFDLVMWLNDDRGAYWDWVDAEMQKTLGSTWWLPMQFVKEMVKDGIEVADDETNMLDDPTIDVTISGWSPEKYDAMVKKFPWTSVYRHERFPKITTEEPKQSEELPFDWTAEDVLDLMQQEKIVVTERITPEPVARGTDPGTSWAAAKSVKNVTDTHKRILAVLEFGNLTDEEIFLRMCSNGYKVSQSGARTRRKELVDMGKVMKVGEKRGLTNRLMTIWGLAEASK